MATKIHDEVRAPQAEVVISAPEIKIPDEVQQRAQALMDRLTTRLQQYTDDYVKRMTAELDKAQAQPQIGTTISGFPYWNCLTYGPYTYDQFTFLPSQYMPNKVVAAGDFCLLGALIWINPVAPPFSPPPTIQLGGRSYNVRFEAINLSTVSDGPDGTFPGTFAPVAPVITPMYWWFPTNDPGVNPNLYEVNVTVDLTLSGQPFAAFSTWHFDPDTEPSFLGLPPTMPQWTYERPPRFMVYHK